MNWLFLLFGALFLLPSVASTFEIDDQKLGQHLSSKVIANATSKLTVRGQSIPIYCDQDLPPTCTVRSEDKIEQRLAQQLELLQKKLDIWFAQNKPTF